MNEKSAPQPTNSNPRPGAYCLHKGDGQAVVYIDGRACYLGKHGSPESYRRYEELTGRPPEPPPPTAPAGKKVKVRRPRKVPSYRKHRGTGQAVVTLSGRDYYMGEYGSPESHAEYLRLIAQWQASGGFLAERAADLTTAELLAAYWSFAQEYYVNGNEPSSHLVRVQQSLRPVHQLYGATAARSFGPLALQVVRDGMVREGLSRKVVNQRVDVIRRAFKWALSRELIPASVVEGLRSVEGLRRGRTAARDSDPVKPAAPAAVEASLAELSEVLADAARFQDLTAARPGEALAVRACDLDRSGPVWTYKPATHKGARLGKARVIFIGPKAQEVLTRWLRGKCPLCGAEALPDHLQRRGELCGSCADRADEAGLAGPWPICRPADEAYYLFSPREGLARWRAKQKTQVKSPRLPGQERKKVKRPERAPGERYSVEAYCRAVARACVKAGVEHWHPHQLRHNAATRIRAEFSLEAARIILGRSSAIVTEIYAEPAFAVARDVVRKIG